MSEKKRKRQSNDSSQRPHKKLAKEPGLPSVVRIFPLPDKGEWAPVLVNAPGVSILPELALKPYTKSLRHGTSSIGRSSFSKLEYLLHTSAHGRLDYTAREEVGSGADGLLKHYIGVYDTLSGNLKLVEAREMTLRGGLRAEAAETEEETKTENPTSARNKLSLQFGNKKAKRAIQDLTRNAIRSAKPDNFGAGQTGSTLDPVASAVVSSIAATAGSMPTREELQAAADESKPRPKPNITAESPAEVYPLEELLGKGVLRQMAVKEWQDAVDAKTDILTRSRFVSHRVRVVVEAGDVRRLKSLKYLLLLLEWYNSLGPGPKGLGRKVKQRDKLREHLSSWGSELVDGVSHRFAEGSVLSRWHVDNLITHICALAITIDNFTTDLYDIREDLKLENKEIKKYFMELGCKVAPPTQNEMAQMKIEKAEAGQHQVAKLRLPLAFPKMRVMVQKKRR